MREFYGGFSGFGAAGSEIDAAGLKIARGDGEDAGGKPRLRNEIVRWAKAMTRLFGHGAADFGDNRGRQRYRHAAWPEASRKRRPSEATIQQPSPRTATG